MAHLTLTGLPSTPFIPERKYPSLSSGVVLAVRQICKHGSKHKKSAPPNLPVDLMHFSRSGAYARLVGKGRTIGIAARPCSISYRRM